MLEDRDTSTYGGGSLQLYGGVTPALAAEAEELLAVVPAEDTRVAERLSRLPSAQVSRHFRESSVAQRFESR